jgi:predicted SAM-dependent methyltransferase
MKLHLGCGKRYIPGFIHIDVVEYDHINHVASIDNLSFIPDESVDLIYNCHVLEHFKRQDVNRVLKEWYRVLKKGSILRTSVPDFEKIVEVYTKYKDLKMVIGPLFGRMDYLYNIHYNTFDFKTIEEELKKAGFKDVYRYNWQETIHKDYDDYSQAYIPHMDKENGILISLNIEAEK